MPLLLPASAAIHSGGAAHGKPAAELVPALSAYRGPSPSICCKGSPTGVVAARSGPTGQVDAQLDERRAPVQRDRSIRMAPFLSPQLADL
jgi:hypothetical protein